jgi:hypothetical protein
MEELIMDLNSQTQSQVTEPQTSPASEGSSAPAAAPQSSTPPSAQTQAAAAAGDPAAQAEVAAYTPNFEYTIGKEKRQFDPLFKDFVKSQEHEKKLRELHEKADGLEIVKGLRDRYKSELEGVRGKFDPVEKELKQLGTFLQKNDLESAFGLLGIPKQKIIDYVAQEIQYRQMSPEERARVDAQKQLRQENYQQLSEAEQLRQELSQQQVDTLSFQLTVLQDSPKFSNAAEIFDSRAGKPGAFMEKLLTVGDWLTEQNGGRVVPPNQVLDILVKEYGLTGESQGSQAPTPPPQSKTVVTAPPAEKPTIKQVSGSKTATPVKQKPKSLEDLKRLQREMAGSQ